MLWTRNRRLFFRKVNQTVVSLLSTKICIPSVGLRFGRHNFSPGKIRFRNGKYGHLAESSAYANHRRTNLYKYTRAWMMVRQKIGRIFVVRKSVLYRLIQFHRGTADPNNDLQVSLVRSLILPISPSNLEAAAVPRRKVCRNPLTGLKWN